MAADEGLSPMAEELIGDLDAQFNRKDAPKQLCIINQQLLPVKGFYFMIHTALATLQPYIVVYMKQAGLSASESGVLFGSTPFLSFLVQPLVGAAADRWRKHKAVLVTATVLTGLFHLLFLAVPPRTPAGKTLMSDARLTCADQGIPTLSVCGDEIDVWATSPCPEWDVVHGNISSSGSRMVYCKPSGSGMRPGDLNGERIPCLKSAAGLLHAISLGLIDLSFAHDCQIECGYLTATIDAAQLTSLCIHNNTDEMSISVCNQTLGDDESFLHSFTLRNLSDYFTINISNQQKDVNNVPCVHFNLGHPSANDSFENNTCIQQSTIQCQIKCELTSDFPHLCKNNWHIFDITFGAIFIIFLASYLSQAPITPMADAALYCILAEKREKFGRQRLFGSMGYLLASGSVSAGAYFLKKEQAQELDYTIMFSAHAVLCGISALIALRIPIPADLRCRKIVKNMRKLLALPKVICFLLVEFYFGFMLGGIMSFLFWFLLDLGAPAYIFGLTRAFCVLAEIPVFYFSGRLVRHFGPIPVLCVAIVAMSIRLLGYSLLDNPWLVLLVEPLHGVIIGLMITAATTYASVVSPPGMAATTQGMVGGMLWGLGRGAGALVTGLMFSAVGARLTYRLYAAAGMVVLVVYSLLYRFVFREHDIVPTPAETGLALSKRGDAEAGDTECSLVGDQQ